MDILTPSQRHKAMKHIHSKNTSIELKLRKCLWHQGIRYRINFKELPGKPDIVITKYKIAIFCDSEFFHGKDWQKKLCKRLEKSANSSYWMKKIKRNINRDMDVNHNLEMEGWTVLRFWGNEINKSPEKCVEIIKETIQEKTTNSKAFNNF